MTGIKVEKAHGDYDPGTSKFFGAPTMPDEWLTDGTIDENDFFFCQLKAKEYSSFECAEILPDSGFIYIFLKEKDGFYSPNVCYSPSEPDAVIEDFNAGFEFLGDTADEYSIDYCSVESCGDGTALCFESGDEFVLLQYDPLDDNMPDFLAETEKLLRFTIKKDALLHLDFSDVELKLV